MDNEILLPRLSFKKVSTKERQGRVERRHSRKKKHQTEGQAFSVSFQLRDQGHWGKGRREGKENRKWKRGIWGENLI